MKMAEKSPKVENTKGEIACYEQFLLYQHIFKRLKLQTCKSKHLFGKGLTTLKIKPYENIFT